MLLKNLKLKMLIQITQLLEGIFYLKIMKEIKNLKPGQGKEIHITDATKNLIYKNEKILWKYF